MTMGPVRMRDFARQADQGSFSRPLPGWGFTAQPGDGLWWGKYGYVPWKLFSELRGGTLRPPSEPGDSHQRFYETADEAHAAMADALTRVDPDEPVPYPDGGSVDVDDLLAVPTEA